MVDHFRSKSWRVGGGDYTPVRTGEVVRNTAYVSYEGGEDYTHVRGSCEILQAPQACVEVDFNDPEREPGVANMLLVCMLHCLQFATMTLIFTTAPEYLVFVGLTSAFWTGFIVALVPGVAACSCFFWQVVNNRLGYGSTNILLSLTGSLGGCLYAMAGHAESLWMLLIGRILMGVASANSLNFHFVGLMVGHNKKSHYVSLLSGAASIGLGVGPLLSGLLDFFSNGIGLGRDAPIIFNVLTIPAWAIVVIYVSLAFGFASLFTPIPVSEQHRFRQLQKVDDKNVQVVAGSKFWLYTKLTVTLVAVVVLGIGNGSSELRSTTIAQANATIATEDGSGFGWSWDIVQAAFYVGGIFCVFSVFNFLQGPICKTIKPEYDDHHWLLIFCIIATIGSMFLYNFHLSHEGSIIVWTFGLLIFNGALLVGKIRSFSLGLKLVPNKWIDTYTPTMLFMNSMSRAIGPLCATGIGDGYLNSNTYALSLSIPLVVTCAVIALVFPHLKPTL